ncbi:hypothetical protein Tco_0447886 [Tanacetum coccineum]
MGDVNPIRTLGDYSRPSHEGYRNTIKLPKGNNVVPLRSDTIRLVQNGCSFHELRSEDPIQHLKDLLRIIAIDHAAGGRLKKLRPEVAWETIEDLAQYEEEGWNEPIFLEDRRLNYKNANIEKLLRAMECRVDTLMKDAISLMGRSENVCGMSRQHDASTTARTILSGGIRGSYDEYHTRLGRKKPRNPSNPQVLPSFEEYTPPVTYPEEVEETLGTLMEVEPLDEPQLEDLGLNTCNHDIPLSSKEIPSVDEPEPQLLPNSSPLDAILGDKRGTNPPINPCSPGSFRKKVVDSLIIHTPPSPHVAYYHPSLGDPKKHYGFKPCLLG